MGYLALVETWIGKGSALSAIFTLLRSPLGIGLFLLPWTIAINGVTQGCFVVAFVILLNAFRSYILHNIALGLTKDGVKSSAGYSDWWLLQGCLGGIKSRTSTCILIFFSTLQWIALLGNASVLFAFCGLNTSQISPDIARESYLNVRLFTCICVAAVVLVHPFVQFIRVKLQKTMEDWGCSSIFSVTMVLAIPAVFTVLVSVPIIIAYSITNAGGQPSYPDPGMFSWGRFPIVIVLSLFVVGASPDDVTLAFGNAYQNTNFSIAIVTSCAITLVIALTFGTLTLLGIQTNICASITLSLPLTQLYGFVRLGSIMCAFITLLFKFQMDPRLASRLTVGEIACDVVFKMVFLSLAGSIAVGLPSMAGIASLFGSTTSVILTILFPFTSDLFMRLTGGRKEADEEMTSLVENKSSFKGHLLKISKHGKTMMIVVDVIMLVGGLCLVVAGLWTTVTYFIDVFQFTSLESQFCPLNITSS